MQPWNLGVDTTHADGFETVSFPLIAKRIVPSTPQANATRKFAWGPINHKKAPPKAANDTITSRIR
jgi:hypothetical protein